MRRYQPILLMVFLVLVTGYYLRTRSAAMDVSYLIWVPLVAIQLIAVHHVLNPKYGEGLRLTAITLYGIAMHFFIQVARPDAILGVDSVFGKTTTDLIIEAGRWDPGSALYDIQFVDQYVLYPGQHFLFAAISLIGGLSTTALHKWAMVVINPVALLFLYLFYRTVLKDRESALRATFLFSTASWFLFFHSGGLHESLGFLFFAGVIYLFTTMEIRRLLAAQLFLFILIFTHHLTSYVLLFIIFLYFLGRTLDEKPLPFVSPFFQMSLVSFSFWVLFIADHVSLMHLDQLESLVRSLTGIQVSESTFSNQYRTTAEILAIYLGGMALYLMGFLGFIKDNMDRRIRVVAASLFIIFFLFGFVAPWYGELSNLANIRWRTMVPAYVFLAIFASLGSMRIKDPRLLYPALLLIAMGGVAQAIPDYYYHPVTDPDNIIMSYQEWASTSEYVRKYIAGDEKVYSTHSGFVHLGALGRQRVTETDLSNPDVNGTVVYSMDLVEFPSVKYQGFRPADLDGGDNVFTTGRVNVVKRGD